MAERTVGVGLVGGGLMGREAASAMARWVHLAPIGVRPRLVHVCDPSPEARVWYERLDPAPRLTAELADVLADDEVEVVYCAIPHNLHEEAYIAILEAGKHLLGEKPFGIDRPANEAINRAIPPGAFVRCSSEFPFYPGGQAVVRWVAEARFGRVLEVRSMYLHSSDLDPNKPANWKRIAATNGSYGCLGDLGMHALHLPLRFGWEPRNVRAILSDVFPERPGSDGGTVVCDIWDNAVLLCEAYAGGEHFPLRIETKRIAPGEKNTWVIEIDGTEGSIAFSTKHPKTLRTMTYEPGCEQEWRVADLGYDTAYPTITGAIFEFSFSDAVLQMWAAFCDELVHGRDGMSQPFHCATTEEAAATHHVFTAAVRSHEERAVVVVG
jgi:predicted dehydrogenase